MADNIGVAATGGTNADGSRWVSYDCGVWEVRAEEQANQSGWEVRLYDREAEDDGYPIAPHVFMSSESLACLVAEAVADAVAWVQGTAQGAASEEPAPEV